MTDYFSLAGRVALVTGAAGHLGAPMARGLAAAGAKVYLLGRNKAPLETLRENIGPQAIAAAVDITDTSQITAFLQSIPEQRLDVLVNNAYAGPSGDAFAQAYALTVTASFQLVRESLPFLRRAVAANGGAPIINIASMHGTVSPDPRVYEDSPPNPPFQGAAKDGLIQLTRHLAAELGPEKIRVNAISPGP